jgi:hypothetical protein
MKVAIGILSLLIIIYLIAAIHSENKIIHCLLGEARGEGLVGMTAVAEVIRNRGGTHGIYGCSKHFKVERRIRDLAQRAWRDSRRSNYVQGATHFHSTDFKAPYWASKIQIVRRIGRHIFYKEE